MKWSRFYTKYTYFEYALVFSEIHAFSAAGVFRYHLVAVRSYSATWPPLNLPAAAFVLVAGPAIHRKAIKFGWCARLLNIDHLFVYN